jgi:hypothetical protein
MASHNRLFLQRRRRQEARGHKSSIARAAHNSACIIKSRTAQINSSARQKVLIKRECVRTEGATARRGGERAALVIINLLLADEVDRRRGERERAAGISGGGGTRTHTHTERRETHALESHAENQYNIHC